MRYFTSQEHSYAGEATCDENADYGYVFSDVDDMGYNLSPRVVLGPAAIPEADDTVAPDQAPTELAVTAGVQHHNVEITWDDLPLGSNITGFAVFRKWQGSALKGRMKQRR